MGLVSVLLFILSALISGKYDGMNDGLNRFGFPFVFFQNTFGKCYECAKLNWFNLYYLIIDFVCWVIFSFIILKIFLPPLARMKGRQKGKGFS